MPSEPTDSPDPPAESSTRVRRLAAVLIAFGLLDLAALAAVVMPREWMAAMNGVAGLGLLPAEPIVGYLARSSSALYSLHGALMLFLASDVIRYAPVIRFLAIAAILHGLVILGIDLAEGMPRWWLIAEGPCFSLTGVVTLVVQAWEE